MKNKVKFKEYMTALGETFDKKISDVLKNVYWKALENVTDKQAENGFNRAFTNCKFFPKPAELLELMIDPVVQIDDRALSNANKIVAHLKYYGSSKRPNLESDPIANELMTTRWPYYEWASRLLESEEKWWVKEFCEAYRAYENTGTPLQIEATEEVKKLVEGIGK